LKDQKNSKDAFYINIIGKIMKSIKTISLIFTLTVTNAFATNYDEFVEISNGHYAKLAADGTLTEVATSADASVNLNKESTEESIDQIKDTIIKAGLNAQKNSLNVKTDGLNMCTGLVIFNQTWQNHEYINNNDSVTLTGSAHFGVGGILPPPAPPLLDSYLRIKTKLRTYDSNNVLLDKQYTIDRNFIQTHNQAQAQAQNLINGFWGLWNNAQSTTSISIINPNIYKVRWTVVSNFMVDAPVALSGSTPGTEDCHATQQIKTSGTFQL
jgi:hypothetical protein